MDKRASIKAAAQAHEVAFSAYLRCDCRNRLTVKGCKHAKASQEMQKAYDALVQS